MCGTLRKEESSERRARRALIHVHPTAPRKTMLVLEPPKTHDRTAPIRCTIENTEVRPASTKNSALLFHPSPPCWLDVYAMEHPAHAFDPVRISVFLDRLSTKIKDGMSSRSRVAHSRPRAQPKRYK